jgi:hypothetical protein
LLDQYCERTEPGLWAEPVNVLSNLAFIVAGLLALRAYRQRPLSGREWDLWTLMAILFAIGLGSTIWHLFATRWALRADTLPIMAFINLYLLSCLFRVLRTGIIVGLLIFAGYHIVNQFVLRTIPPGFLNGSVYYLPTWLFLAGITVTVAVRGQAIRRGYMLATGLFTLSLGFRSVDELLCGGLPLGTHFLWHLLNAVTLYILLVTLFEASGERDRHLASTPSART